SEGDWASFQTSACSRPPDPATRTRIAKVYERLRGSDGSPQARPDDDADETERDARDDARQRDGHLARLHEVERLLRERRECREPTTEPDHERRAEPLGRVPSVDERGDQETDQDAPRHVDHERAPRKGSLGSLLDRPVEPVPCQRAERSGDCDTNGY